MALIKNEHDLLQELIDSRARIEALNLELDVAKKAAKDAEEKLIGFLDNRDIKGFKSEVLRVEVEKQEELKVSINEEKKDEAYTYIDEELGRGDVIKIVKQIHWKTLHSLIGSRIKKGEPLPEGMFNFFWFKSIKTKSM